jgi:hypothetical protein
LLHFNSDTSTHSTFLAHTLNKENWTKKSDYYLATLLRPPALSDMHFALIERPPLAQVEEEEEEDDEEEAAAAWREKLFL